MRHFAITGIETDSLILRISSGLLIYRKRRDAMLHAFDRHLPAAASFHPPQGGLFVCLRLPDGLSADELLPLACKEGVAFKRPAPRFSRNGTRAVPP
jgi:DNA-binding transcriptional MocR family regulator